MSGPAGHVGVIYLLHFSKPYKHAAGITWQLARTWGGSRALERRIKRQGVASRHCPLCLAGGASKAQHRELAAAGITEGADPWPTA